MMTLDRINKELISIDGLIEMKQQLKLARAHKESTRDVRLELCKKAVEELNRDGWVGLTFGGRNVIYYYKPLIKPIGVYGLYLNYQKAYRGEGHIRMLIINLNCTDIEVRSNMTFVAPSDEIMEEIKSLTNV